MANFPSGRMPKTASGGDDFGIWPNTELSIGECQIFIREMPIAASSDSKRFIGEMRNLAFQAGESGISPDRKFGISDANIIQSCS
jgi:hypothetical protein